MTAKRIVGTMLQNSPTVAVKKSVISAMSEIYLGHFRFAIDHGNLEEGYSVIEEARGRVAADRLRAGDHDPRPRPEIAAAERRLALLQIRLLNTQEEAERKRLTDSLTEVERQSPFDENSPPVNTREQLRLRDLQAVLNPNEVLLEFVVDEPDSSCLVITHSRVEVVHLPSRKSIESLTETYVAAIKQKSLAVSEARQLYSAVVGPAKHLIENLDLIVVPDGVLHGIPFGPLVDGEGHYLLQTHTIDYAPSGSVLALLRRSHPAGHKELLAVGNVAYGDEVRPNGRWPIFRGLESLRRRGLMPLPATQDEVQSVAASMQGFRDVILSGKDATESNFKRETSKGASIIHVAVHAFADTDHPDRAGLVFAVDNSGEDGLLQVREIRRLPLLGTALVTLSACDTSAGSLDGQEGVSSIVSAFLYAGARTTVTTFWSIEDSSTSELMKIFYRELAHGQSKGRALQTAQFELLRRGEETKAPYFWAAFGLVGDGSRKIEESTGNDKRGT
jgi:CHAT domain-containing protein